MVLLCTDVELIRYRVPQLLTEYAAAQFIVHSFPMEDGANPEIAIVLHALETLRQILAAGKKVTRAVHEIKYYMYNDLSKSCKIS